MLIRPKLTLAVIVKDEGQLLKGVLEHHRGLYDEAVVVDTGSSDSSRQVALDAGAKLVEFPWIDDFSAARNHGLDQASGNWILQLDCDERIAPRDFQALATLAAQPADHCRTLTIHNYTSSPRGRDWLETEPRDRPWSGGAPGYWKTQTVRFFPNTPELRFSGLIHENLTAAIGNMGLPLVQSSIVIHHTGLISEEGKIRREKLYGPLLAKKFREDPNDIRAIAELASFLVGKNELLTAKKLLLHSERMGVALDNDVQASLLLVEIQTRLGKLEEARKRLETSIRRFPDQLLCWVLAVALNLARHDQSMARIYLDQGRKLFPGSPVLKAFEKELLPKKATLETKE